MHLDSAKLLVDDLEQMIPHSLPFSRESPGRGRSVPSLSASSAGVDTRQEEVMQKIRRPLTCEALAGKHLLAAGVILVKAAVVVGGV